MELLGETAIKSIAELCGVKLTNNDDNENDDSLNCCDNSVPNNSSEYNSDNKCSYIIRRGIEDDVFQDTKRY